VLDARNAIISNGLIYAGDSNEPFTGKVTNIPDTKILLNQPVTRLMFAPLRSLYAADGAVLDTLLLSVSLCDVKVSKGVLDGDALCKFPQSQAKRYEMSFRNGLIDGNLTFYGPSSPNSPVIKAAIKAGVLDGTLEIFSPKTQKLVHREQLKNGVNQGASTFWDEGTGKEIGRATYVDGKVDGPINRYAPDGKTVTYRAAAVADLLDGTEEVFDAQSGARIRKTEWRKGKRHGAWQEWASDGRLKVDSVYQDDQLVSSKIQATSNQDGDTSACESAWQAAHRKESGPDAVVTLDQLNEWQSWCRQGRSPG
jgi:antitoxin component YwqK of YwqJK toxin-antitoxin module